MGVEIWQQSGNLLVKLSGELDHHTAEELKEVINREWEKDLTCNIIFDLENLSFMDSSGVGVIMGRYKQVSKTGGKIALCNLSPHLKKVIELSGLLKLVYLYGNVEEALRELALT